MRLAQSSQAYGNVDRTWLGSTLESQEFNMGVTLDLSLFPSTPFASGSGSEVRVPSGTNVGLVAATGLGGPYDPSATDGRQTSAGLLLNDVSGIGGRDSQALVRSGVVFLDRLPFPAGVGIGKVDPATQTTLKLIDFRTRGVL